MKLFLFLTFVVGFFATSGVDSCNIGYRLALAPLELFLKHGQEQVSRCYEKNKDDYERSILDFLSKVEIIKNVAYESSSLPSKSFDYLTWAWKEMENVGNGLNNFFLKLKENIFNGKLVEGGKLIWRQRVDIENYYEEYMKCGKSLKDLNKQHYDSVFSLMDGAFKVILGKSDELTKKLLQCLEDKNISYRKKFA